MMHKKVLVTGGTGKAGRWVIKDLLEHGYEVTNVDLAPSDLAPTFRSDLNDLGQTFGVVEGKDAIIHLAAIPWAGEHAGEVVFRNNVMCAYNILQAAYVLGVNKVVLAGSESSLGFPFKIQPITPQYLPIDEDHPLAAQDAYGLSKMVLEELGKGYARRDPKMSISCLRLSYIQPLEDYPRELKSAWSDLELNGFNLWCYVDARDAASACRLAVEYSKPGYDAFYIAAKDTLMREPTLELVERYFPGIDHIDPDFGGRASPLNCTHAEKTLGWTASHTWEMALSPQQREELSQIRPKQRS
jgi:nucleoside-diphosphate-sugar epimerase